MKSGSLQAKSSPTFLHYKRAQRKGKKFGLEVRNGREL